ncbi:MAG: AsmA family protein [Nitrospinota bacterium]|jgi:uncharacterized protein involved in outer membrane biogenesis|nr:AsmA family protein [Nitrospinota bacterium]
MWRAKKKRSAAGRFFKALGVLVLLCLALLLAVPYLVNLDGFRTRLVRELSQRLGRPVEVSSLRFRTLPRLNLDILGLRILDPPEFGGKAALTAESLRVNVRILPLLRGRLEVQSLGLERPVVVLRRNRSGFNNLFGPRSAPPPVGRAPVGRPAPAETPPPEPSAEPSSLLAGLLIGNVNIENAGFRIEDAKAGAPVALDGIHVAIKRTAADSPITIRLEGEQPGLEMNAVIGPVNWGDIPATPADVRITLRPGWIRALRPWIGRYLRGDPLHINRGEISGDLSFRGNLNRATLKADISIAGLAGRIFALPLKEDPQLVLRVKSDLKISKPDPRASPAFQGDGEISVGGLLLHWTARGTTDSKNRHFEAEIQGARLRGADLLSILKAILKDKVDALKIAGLIGFNVKIKGKGRDASVDLTLDAGEVRARCGDLFQKGAGIPLKLAGKWVSAPGRIEIKPIAFDLRQIRFRGEVRQSGGSVSLRVDSEPFDLEGLDTLFPQLRPLGLAGRTRIGLIANGAPAEVLKKNAQLQVTIEDGAATIPGGPIRIRDLGAFLLVTPRSAQISRSKARIGKSRLELEATLVDFSAPRIRFDLRAPSFLLEDFLPKGRPPDKAAAADPPLIRKVSWSPRRPARLSVAQARKAPRPKPTLADSLKGVRAEGTLRIEKGEARSVRFENLFAALRLQDGKVIADPLKAALYGGTLKAAGEYALDREPAAFRGRLTLRAVRIEKAIADHAPGPPWVTGRADLDADAEGVGTEAEALKRSLSARGKISIQDGEVRNIAFLANVERLTRMPGIFGLKDGKKRFQRLEGAFEIRKGKVRFPSLRLDSPGLSMNAKGEVGFDLRSRLDVTATFDKKATRTLSKGLLGALLGAGEKLEIPFRVRGPLLAPRVSLDPRFLQKSLGRNPEKFIRDALDRLLR